MCASLSTYVTDPRAGIVSNAAGLLSSTNRRVEPSGIISKPAMRAVGVEGGGCATEPRTVAMEATRIPARRTERIVPVEHGLPGPTKGPALR
jgi:hypothetical protein